MFVAPAVGMFVYSASANGMKGASKEESWGMSKVKCSDKNTETLLRKEGVKKEKRREHREMWGNLLLSCGGVQKLPCLDLVLD